MSDSLVAGIGDRGDRGLRSLNVCLILSGSIAAYKACELASRLVKAGHQVQTVATEGALRFVGVASLEGITDRKVYTDLWAPRESKSHIGLRRWSDLFVFYPATANRINALAAGLAPDLVGATFLANNFEKPFWIAPAMNTGMLEHPATSAALEKLASWGCRIVYGESGELACRDKGPGRLVEASAMFALIQEEATRVALAKASGPTRRALVTGGAMTEPVDAVRAIVNSSTGRTSTAIVRELLERGWEVDYLHHESAALEGSEGSRRTRYKSYKDFDASLGALLAERPYDAIVHAAAVSDYSAQARTEKLESTESLEIKLLPNVKIIKTLRGRAKGDPVIVGFKLTIGADESEGARRASASLSSERGPGDADGVVWNDMAGLGNESHDFVLFSGSSGSIEALERGGNNHDLAQAVARFIEGRLSSKKTGGESERRRA